MFTCDGANLSPALNCGTAPAGTESFALVLADPDAPGATFIHWLVANVPPATTHLPQAWDAGAGVVLGGNDFGGQQNYLGPCPPPDHDAHTYQFRVFALDSALALNGGYSLAQLNAAMAGHIITEGLLTGMYDR